MKILTSLFGNQTFHPQIDRKNRIDDLLLSCGHFILQSPFRDF